MQTKLEMYIDTNVFYELEKSAREADKSVADYVRDFLPTLIKNNNGWSHSLSERQKAMEEEIHPDIEELCQILKKRDNEWYETLGPITKKLLGFLRTEEKIDDKEAIYRYLAEKYK